MNSYIPRVSMRSGLCFFLLVTLLSMKSLNAAAPAIMRDPTQPVIMDVGVKDTTAKKETVYVLQSIILSPTRQLALINSKFVRVGDKIDDAIVKNIGKNSVDLLLSGNTLVLYLFEQSNWE